MGDSVSAYLDGYSKIIESIYEAAVDSSKWPRFLENIARAVGGRATALVKQDYRSGYGVWDGKLAALTGTVGFDASYLKSLGEHYWMTNPWIWNSERLPEGAVTTSEMFVPNSVLERSEWYSDWLGLSEFRSMI